MTARSMDDEVFAARPDLSADGGLPAHARIEHWLAALIESGTLRPGDRLPAELDMASSLGISRMTLRQALSTMATNGLLERRRGRFGGTFVTRPRFDFSLTGLPGFTEQMRRAHVEAGARVVHATTRPASADERAALRLKRGGLVHEVIRVRSADGDSIALEETYLPADVFPDLLTRNLTGSLYELMDQAFGRSPFSAEEVVEPAIATAQQAELLEVNPGQPLLVVTRTAFTIDGTAVEFAHDYFRPDRTRLMLRTQVDHTPTTDPAASE